MTTPTHIAFRTDATSQIGTGHFMRCLTLALALKQNGSRVSFVCRNLLPHLQKQLSDYQITLISLPEATTNTAVAGLAHAQWLGTTQDIDASQTLASIGHQKWDWLVVDHYALDAHWETQARKIARRIFAIDDLADRSHDCDVLLDQNLHVDMAVRYLGKVPTHSQQLLGPQYALLRTEFSNLRAKARVPRNQLKKILVFLGGVDATNATEKAVDAILQADQPSQFQVDVVIGDSHPAKHTIVEKCRASGFNCLIQTNEMAELMLRADIAIGAGGSASWERCALGLPSILLALANNQTPIAKALSNHGAAFFLGADTQVTTTMLTQSINQISLSTETLASMSRRAFELTDGKGCHRIIQTMH